MNFSRIGNRNSGQPEPVLLRSWHGKSSVRVAKVTRRETYHDFAEYSVDATVVGGIDASFTDADNSNLVATDTIKNHVYLLAKDHAFNSPELFALDLAMYLLNLYEWFEEVSITVTERAWRRSRVDMDGHPHAHGFTLDADGTPFARVKVQRRNGVILDPQLTSGFNR